MNRQFPFRRLAGLACIALLVATACSKSPSSSTPSTAAAQAAPCKAPVPPTPASASAVSPSASDWDLTSFDGTRIRLHWFPNPAASAQHPDPTVLMGPGWGMGGDTNTTAVGIFGALNIASLRAAGYNVLTWDPRGFGQSAGTVEVDSPDFEARDVSSMLDWIATRPGVLLDAPGDPRVGMVGGSYGGGIQLVAAEVDCRIDAIVPVISWNSLVTSLYKGDTAKIGWGALLYTAVRGRSVDPHVTEAYQSGNTSGVASPALTEWYAQRGPASLLGRLKAPTLLIQGTVDNLFTLDEAIANYSALHGRGLPVGMIWYCGGHGVCLTNRGDPGRVSKASIAWLDRYVKRDAGVDTGPGFEFIDQNGASYSAAAYPLAAGTPIMAEGKGTLALVADGGSGPVPPRPAAGSQVSGSNGSASPSPLDAVVKPITPAKAANAVNVGISLDSPPAVILGAPELSLTYHGSAPSGDRPERVFAQLVDDATGIVVGNQITPIPVTLDGASHQVTVPLEVIAFSTQRGSHLTVQIVATTVAYAQPRLGGTVELDQIHVSLPVASGLAPG
jgi:ABC-2 type transport system ATP-binding protein